MFTIEVKKRGKDEKFDFKDLEMFHQECYGGKIELKEIVVRKTTDAVVIQHYGESRTVQWELICQRCREEISIKKERESLNIVQTAIDGEERKLSENIRVIQKT